MAVRPSALRTATPSRNCKGVEGSVVCRVRARPPKPGRTACIILHRSRQGPPDIAVPSTTGSRRWRGIANSPVNELAFYGFRQADGFRPRRWSHESCRNALNGEIVRGEFSIGTRQAASQSPSQPRCDTGNRHVALFPQARGQHEPARKAPNRKSEDPTCCLGPACSVLSKSPPQPAIVAYRHSSATVATPKLRLSRLP